MVDHTLSYAVVGSPETIKAKIAAFLDMTGADELIISMPIYDMEARLKSVRLFGQAYNALAAA